MQTKMYAFAEVKDAEGDDPSGNFDVILSAPTLDRDGEIVDSKIFEPLPDHITFDIDHGMSTATTVGSGVPSYDGENLRVKGTYSSIPRAQEVRTLVREGHIRTTSVAFMGAVREQKDGVTHITKAELLNGAFVPIPSNRESLVLSAKNYDEALDAKATKGDRLQSIHDLSVQNGAACVTSDNGKSVTRSIIRKAFDMTANDLRNALDHAVGEAVGALVEYAWVRDYTDEWVVFEVGNGNECDTYQQGYTVTDGVVALDGEAVPVAMRTVYEPIPKALSNSSTEAPVTPAVEAGKSPASDVVEQARLRAELALLA